MHPTKERVVASRFQEMNVRMLPSNSRDFQSCTVHGRPYHGEPGQVIDIPEYDAPALVDWRRVAFSGPTSARPTNPSGDKGFYIDTDLGLFIVWDGQTWRDPVNGKSV